MADPERCYCGHVRRNHIKGEGLCLNCRRPICLIFRALDGEASDDE